MRSLIINADGYGFTAGISRAIEECVAFGTVRSLSANVNFPHADSLVDLVRRHPDLSVGCHLNPVVGRPVLPPQRVPSLLNPDGEFHYKSFTREVIAKRIRIDELRAELLAQVDKTRQLAGRAFSHVDFHMGLHRLPSIYPLFLEVARQSGTGRIRTHRYYLGLERRFPRLVFAMHLCRHPIQLAKYAWNLHLRRKAKRCGLAMPDRWVTIMNMHRVPAQVHLEDFVQLLWNLPQGISEFVAHPAYLDDELKRYSTYLEPREQERAVLLDDRFRTALRESGVHLAGYRDIPRGERAAQGTAAGEEPVPHTP
jgi:predicted glycoside hydrolase/deacetylase ChbG (UPF0249 family)